MTQLSHKQLGLELICQRIADKYGLSRDERFGKAVQVATEWALYEGLGLDGIEWYLDLLLKPYVYRGFL